MQHYAEISIFVNAKTNVQPSLTVIKGTLMQIRKSPYIFMFI